MTQLEQLEIIKKEFSESCVQDIQLITEGILEEDLIIIILYETYLATIRHDWWKYNEKFDFLKRDQDLSSKIIYFFNWFNWSKSSQKYLGENWNHLAQRYQDLAKVWKYKQIPSQFYPIH